MARITRMCLAATIVFGCGSPAPRLQVPTYEIDGHEEVQFSQDAFGTRYYFDVTRQEPCAPALWDDGSIRCTPDLDLRAEPYYSPTRDACPISRLEGLTIVGSGSSFVASDFVEMSPSEEVPSGATLGVRLYDYAGASHVPYGFYNPLVGAPCNYNSVAVEDVAVNCVPVAYSADSMDEYEDDSCSTAPVLAIPHACGQVTNAVGYIPINLLVPVSAHPTHIEIPQHSAGPPAACNPLEANQDADYFRGGSAVAPVEITRTTEPSAGRIHRIDASDGAVQIADGLYDGTLGTECVIRRVADGTFRCVPFLPLGRPPTLPPAYSDAQCTQPIDLVDSDSFRATWDTDPAYDLDTDGVITSLRDRGTPYSGPIFYASAANGCFSSSVPMFTPGRLLDFGELAEAVIVSD